MYGIFMQIHDYFNSSILLNNIAYFIYKLYSNSTWPKPHFSRDFWTP